MNPLIAISEKKKKKDTVGTYISCHARWLELVLFDMLGKRLIVQTMNQYTLNISTDLKKPIMKTTCIQNIENTYVMTEFMTTGSGKWIKHDILTYRTYNVLFDSN